MKKRILLFTVIVALLVCSLHIFAFAEQQNDTDIIILYENDVHCEIEGYSVISAMRNELKQTHTRWHCYLGRLFAGR